MRKPVPFAALAALVLACWPARAEPVSIGKIEAFLVYSQTGKLSFDLLSKKDISLWNTGAGEGDAGGAADDVLLVLHFAAPQNAENPDPVSVSVTGNGGKSLLSVKALHPDFIGGTAAAKAYLLQNVICQPVKITVSASKKTVTKTIPFACGE